MHKGKNMKIMVVDDEFVSRLKMQKILSDFGEITPIENGQDAINSFRKAMDEGDLFSLITLDIDMPGVDGLEALFEIREIEKEKEVVQDKQVKILMVTSHSGKDHVITAVQAGCNEYIVKPFNKEVVVKKLFDLDVPIPI